MIIDRGLDLVNAKTGSLMLIDPESNYMTMKSAKGIPEKIRKKVRVKIGDGIAGFVAESGEAPVDVKGAPAAVAHGIPGVFDALKDKELMRLGVPEEQLSLVRSVQSEIELESIVNR